MLLLSKITTTMAVVEPIRNALVKLSIQVLGWERNKGGIRLTFIAGWRTLKLMGQQQQIMKDVSKQLNSSETDIPAKVAQLLTSQKENEKQYKQ